MSFRNLSYIVIQPYLTTFLLLALCSGLSLYGQKLDIEKLRTTYPDEDVVFLRQKEHLVIDLVAEELAIRKECEEAKIYLTDNDLRYANESIHYTDFSDIENIVAQTQIPIRKGKYKANPVSDIETKDVMISGIFYGDYKKKAFVFPAVQEGAITELNYQEIIKDPRMLGAFYFNSYLPLLDAEYSVSFPEVVQISYKLLGEYTDQIEFSEKRKDGMVTYTWKARNLPEYEREEDALSRNYYNPHIILRIDKIKLPGKEERILSGVEDLYKWYSSLVKQINQTDQGELKEIVSQLTAGISDEEEKTRRIFQWVQKNISYVAFEDGMGGFIPRDAAAVCNKKYGDCKDMANLLREMLNYADVEAYLCWIGTREKPYSYQEVPTPVVDNHMIAAARLNGKLTFLDATGSYTPYGLPTSMIQGKEALVGISDSEFSIERVPEVGMEQNQRIDSAFVRIEDRELKGKANTQLTGYKKVDLEYGHASDSEDAEKAYFIEYLSKGSNNFALNEYALRGMGDLNAPGEIEYDFEIPGYAKAAGNRMFVNLHLDRPLTTSAINVETRRYGREIEYKYQNRYHLALEIPNGYVVSRLPENISYQQEKWGFDIQYRQEGNQVILDKIIYVNTLALHKQDFEGWNQFVDQLVKAFKKTVVFTQEGE